MGGVVAAGHPRTAQAGADVITRRSVLGSSGRVSYLGGVTAAWTLLDVSSGAVVTGGATERARQLTHDLTTGKTAQVTDVTPATVEATFARFGIDTMIHGHTHRPALHDLRVNERECKRIVLGDWYEQGSVLRVDASGFRLESLP